MVNKSMPANMAFAGLEAYPDDLCDDYYIAMVMHLWKQLMWDGETNKAKNLLENVPREIRNHPQIHGMKTLAKKYS